nr:pre-B-cell leukemia homeobox interacting protein 1b isoform X1 [Misgurnus anguillicaudatus]
MSANSNGASGNSWTLLTPEVKAGVENVGSVADGTKAEGDPACLTARKPSTGEDTDLVKNPTEAPLPKQCDSVQGHESEDTKQIHPPESQVKPSETQDQAELNAAEVHEDPTSVSGTVEDLSSWTPDHQEQGAFTGHSESQESPSTDVDSYSDSYTHISPTSGSSTSPASVCQGKGFSKSEESHLKKTRTEDFKPDVKLSEAKEKEGDGLRKRKITHVGSLDQGKAEAEDDEEGEEEDFQMPQREEEKVFSLNKCIFAAVILLGLGTIFFSGVLMDSDDEGDVDVKEFKDPANKEWLNPEVSSDTPVGYEPPDILSKQAIDDQQILALQAQLEQHQGELKTVQRLAEEGEKERMKREELEKDYQLIKEELDRLPALQKELEQANERMKEESERAKKDLEALPSLHRELEHLRTKVSELTQSTVRAEPAHPVATSGMPSSGDIRNEAPIEPQDSKNVKYWDKKSVKKEKEKELKKNKGGKKDGKKSNERETGEEHAKEKKDWKKDKSNPEEGKSGKTKEWKDENVWKKDKNRGDVKMVKENKDTFKEWDEKKGDKEQKKMKKSKHQGQDESMKDDKDWKNTGNKKVKEDKEKEWKQRGERKDWKTEKEWKKNDKPSGWKEEKKEWKKKDIGEEEKEWRNGKSKGKLNDKTEKKWKGGEKEFHKGFAEKEIEENHWTGKKKERSTDWKIDEHKSDKKNKAHHHKYEKSHNEKVKRNKDDKERSNSEKPKHGQSDHTSSHHHNDQRQHNGGHHDYWSRQRQKIQHNSRKSKACNGVTECAHVEGLSPVSLHNFEILLQSYLKKIQTPEDQTSGKEELSKLVREFFTDGVFAHDQIPFSEFVEDVADILEDMADGEESDEEDSAEDDDDADEEMEEFEREAMEMFALPEETGKKKSRKARG